MSIRAVSGRTLPLILFFPSLLILLAVIFEYSGLDIWWVSLFYDTEKQAWTYGNHWLFQDIIHSGGQLLDKVFAVLWLLAFLVINLKKELRQYRKILLYFILASGASPALVGIAKHLTHIYSPWDLQVFNGIHPHIRLFDSVPSGAPVGNAFPAGHASGGYCFISLFFVFLRYRSSYRTHALIFSLGLGLAFGVAQQIRGAHFPSHDLATLFICWYISLVFYFIFYPEEWRALANR